MVPRITFNSGTSDYLIRVVLELDSVPLHVCEVLLCLLGGGCTQTLVVLDPVRMPVLSCSLPFGKLWQRVERDTLQGKENVVSVKHLIYSGGSNTERSKTESIRKPNVLKVSFRMVRFSNGRFHSLELWNRPFKMAALV